MLSKKNKTCCAVLSETKYSIPTMLNIITLTESHSINTLKDFNILWELRRWKMKINKNLTQNSYLIWPELKEQVTF
jgi:hypothetical protein